MVGLSEMQPPRSLIEVAPRVYQVRLRGTSSFLLLDSRVTIVDTGTVGSGRRILEALNAAGRRPDEVEQIIITHYHPDHMGSLPELRQRLGMRTAVHVLEAPFVEGRLPMPNVFPRHRNVLSRVAQPILERWPFTPVPVDLVLHDGDELPVLGGLRVVHTPGHTPGHVCLYVRDLALLVVGDALQYRRGALDLPSRVFTEDMDEARRSVAKLALLEVQTIAFSHFRPVQRAGSEHLRRFALEVAPAG